MNPAMALTVGIVGGLIGLNALAGVLGKKTQVAGEAGGKAVESELPEKRVGGRDPVSGDLRPDRQAREGAAEHLRVIEKRVFKNAQGKFVKADGTHKQKPVTLPQTA